MKAAKVDIAAITLVRVDDQVEGRHSWSPFFFSPWSLIISCYILKSKNSTL